MEGYSPKIRYLRMVRRVRRMVDVTRRSAVRHMDATEGAARS